MREEKATPLGEDLQKAVARLRRSVRFTFVAAACLAAAVVATWIVEAWREIAWATVGFFSVVAILAAAHVMYMAAKVGAALRRHALGEEE